MPKRYLLLITTLLCLSHGNAGELPGFVATYKADRPGIGAAVSTVTLKRHADAMLSYESYSKPIGVAGLLFGKHRIIEHSSLKEIDGRIVPLKYSYRHEGSDKDRNMNYEFNWEKRELTGIVRGKPLQLELPDNTLDGLTLQLAVASDLQSGKRNIAYPVISRDRIKTYQFTDLGEERIELGGSTFNTIRLQRIKDDRKKTTHTIWYARELDYLPVKTVREEKGKVVLIVTLESLQGQDGKGFQTAATSPQSSSAQAK